MHANLDKILVLKNVWTFSEVLAGIKVSPKFCCSVGHNCTAKYKLNSLSTEAPIISPSASPSGVCVTVSLFVSLSICFPTCLAFCQYLYFFVFPLDHISSACQCATSFSQKGFFLMSCMQLEGCYAEKVTVRFFEQKIVFSPILGRRI